LKELEEIFRSKVLAILKAEGKVNDGVIEELMAWHHRAFSVHAGNQIARDDCGGQKALAEYILRNAFSEQEITFVLLLEKCYHKQGTCQAGSSVLHSMQSR
jgi:hypothetical protein